MAPLGSLARLLALPILAAVALAASPALGQQNLRLVEQDVKAGLLYNFLRYTEWPTAGPETVVCVFGMDPFNGRLTSMEGRTVNQSAIAVRDVSDFEDVDACSLLFVSADERNVWPQLRSYLDGKAVLTVSDYDGFAVGGGMIEFTRDDQRIGVRINVDAVGDADLAVQDRLLRLASTVHTGEAPR